MPWKMSGSTTCINVASSVNIGDHYCYETASFKVPSHIRNEAEQAGLNPRHASPGMSPIAVGIKIRGGFFGNRIAF